MVHQLGAHVALTEQPEDQSSAPTLDGLQLPLDGLSSLS